MATANMAKKHNTKVITHTGSGTKKVIVTPDIQAIKNEVIDFENRCKGHIQAFRQLLNDWIKDYLGYLNAVDKFIQATKVKFLVEGKLNREKFSTYLKSEIGYALDPLEKALTFRLQVNLNTDGTVNWNVDQIVKLSEKSLQQSVLSQMTPFTSGLKKEYTDMVRSIKKAIDPNWTPVKATKPKTTQTPPVVVAPNETSPITSLEIKDIVKKFNHVDLISTSHYVMTEMYGRFKGGSLQLDSVDIKRLRTVWSVLGTIVTEIDKTS